MGITPMVQAAPNHTGFQYNAVELPGSGFSLVQGYAAEATDTLVERVHGPISPRKKIFILCNMLVAEPQAGGSALCMF